MNYPDDWAIFPIIKNGKKPAVSGWQEKQIPRNKIKDHKGNLGLATGMISGGIVVFDWDLRRGHNRKEKGFDVVYKEYCDALPFLAETYICETPNGYHFYYRYIDDKVGNTRNENAGYTSNNKNFVSKCKTKFPKFLAGVDTRANGGYVIVPPSTVAKKRYNWINDNDIVEINKVEYEQILHFFKPEKKTVIRQGFVDILLGKINPNDVKTEKNYEHVYWKEMYRECLTVGGLLPQDLFKGLKKFQKGFDIDKTKVQLNNDKVSAYITNGRRMTKKKYEQYFPEYAEDTRTEQTDMMEMLRGDPPQQTPSEGILFEGKGILVEQDDGIFLETVRGKQFVSNRILDGKFKVTKKTFDYSTNRMLLSGVHNNTEFRTLPVADLLVRLNDFIYNGTVGRDCVKRLINATIQNIPSYELSHVLGFNSHWNLPMMEDEKKVQIITSTEMQMKTYNKAKNLPVKYTEEQKSEIRDLLKRFLDRTQLNKVKIGIIVGWSIAAPFRHAFIDYMGIFPILCAHGNRNTGKSAVLEYFTTHFFGVHDGYIGSGVFNSPSQFEDWLSTSSFPIFIEEVIQIPELILQIIKEHTTGTTEFRRKRSARELDFECIKSAGLAIDCNHLIKSLTDPATNTKVLLLPFTEDEIIEQDPRWVELRAEIKKFNLFSLLYDYTQNWSKEEVIRRIKKIQKNTDSLLGVNRAQIEKTNPRLISQFEIVSFGIDLFNEVFDIEFDKREIINTLLGSRTVMTQSVLNDFHSFCRSAIYYDPESRSNPKYLNHELKEYNSKKFGKGFFFEATNKADFSTFTKKKHTFSELIEQLKDALIDKHKTHIQDLNTGRKRGIFISQKFFEDAIIKGKE